MNVIPDGVLHVLMPNQKLDELYEMLFPQSIAAVFTSLLHVAIDTIHRTLLLRFMCVHKICGIRVAGFLLPEIHPAFVSDVVVM